VTNRSVATNFDDNLELTAGVSDPDYLAPLSYQEPRAVRFAARWEF